MRWKNISKRTWKELLSIGLLIVTALTCIKSSMACATISPITLTILAYILGRDTGFIKGKDIKEK